MGGEKEEGGEKMRAGVMKVMEEGVMGRGEEVVREVER